MSGCGPAKTALKSSDTVGPFSPAVRAGSFLFVSGQIPRDPDTRQMAGPTIEAQTRQVLENLKSVLEAAGSSLKQVVKVTIFLDNMDNYAAVNKIYSEYFTHDPPARACVQVARLPLNVKIEIEAIALAKE
ncbi:MAG: hypothetical protein AMJ79_13435 [Phycisphaerae bacterium SM23_30]|nr:MAG: hypothetical protein AMJ79_13435 [Phycisphaerae bacterium SM23_30]